jgi:hypothetical protein
MSVPFPSSAASENAYKNELQDYYRKHPKEEKWSKLEHVVFVP